MSDQKFDDNEKVDLDLENLAYGRPQSQKPPFSEEEQTSQGLNPEQADRSLSAIHTGSRAEHEAAASSHDNGAKDDEAASLDTASPQSDGDNLDLSNPLSGDDLNAAITSSETGAPELDLAEIREVAEERVTERLLQDTTLSSEQNSDEPIGTEQTASVIQETRVGDVEAEVDEDDTPRQNLAPDEISLDDNLIVENSAVGELVGTVSARDDQGGKLTYTLSDDAGGKFTIDPATGEIRVAGDLDYETATSHEIVVEV
ncbi:MAG: cadherin repeat domain-containing protein, partial [Sneathiella sp.]|nr:cadherin repeat domain-containing protein [Sneathiella sp.]